MQEACIGLVTAVDRYDPGSIGPFGSYASLWILQNIGEHRQLKGLQCTILFIKKKGTLQCNPILKENGYLNSDIWTDQEVRRLIQERLGCSINQAEVIIQQSMPIESLDTVYENVFEKHRKG